MMLRFPRPFLAVSLVAVLATARSTPAAVAEPDAPPPPSTNGQPNTVRGTVDALLARARDLMSKNLNKRAMEAANTAIQLNSKDPRPYFLKAQISDRQGDLVSAETLLGEAMALAPDEPTMFMERGLLRLRRADFIGAVADFDRLADLRPGSTPELWQRGIAQFYAGRFADGRKQFELHRTVNPHDVENSAWHFACVAWAENFEVARKNLLPCEGDARVPLTEIQALYAGQTTPAAVLAKADAQPEGPARLRAQFYAHLYLAMFHGAERKPELETRHAAEAARLGTGLGIMGDIARVHADWVAARLRKTPR